MELDREAVQESAAHLDLRDSWPGKRCRRNCRAKLGILDPNLAIDKALSETLKCDRAFDVEVRKAASDAGEAMSMSVATGRIVRRLVDGELAPVGRIRPV